MRRFALLLPCLAALTDARAADPDPAALLLAAHANHADQTARGLKSFTARVTVRRADDGDPLKVWDQVAFSYSFTAPDQESFDFAGTPESVQKPVREAFRGLWRESTGALWFGAFESAKDLRIEPADPFTIVSGTSAATGAFRASFDKSSPRLAEAVLGDQSTRVWTCVPSDQGLRVRRRDVSLNGALVYFSIYDVPRDVRGFSLPTVVRMKANGNETEFRLEYVRLNDQPASATPIDPAVVKAKVDEFEKGWRAFSEDEKPSRVRELAELDHDLASAAIAKLALKDPAAAVRTQAAESLGTMRRANVVPALLTAMGANEKEILVYLKIVGALGEIGDARAVDALSKDWWNQRIPEYAAAAARSKIRALGKIRDVASVDALLDVFTLVDGGGGSRKGRGDSKANELKPDVVESLTKLTGQNFLLDRKAWDDWWKKNRAGFRF
jgi:hypothetical protein